MTVLYRSTLLRACLAVATLIMCLPVLVGPPKWRNSPSFDFLTAHHLPIRAWAVAFLIYAFLLIADVLVHWSPTMELRLRTAAWFLGGLLFLLVTAAIVYTIPKSPVTNSFATLALVQVVAFHAFAVWTVGHEKGLTL